MNIDSILTLKKHAGRTLQDIWTGKTLLDENDILKNYVIEICSFILEHNSSPLKIPASDFNLTLCSNEILFINQSFTDRKIEFSGSNIIVEAEDKNIPLAFFKLLTNVLTGSYIGWPKYYIRGDETQAALSPNSINFQFLQADAQYIKWCIENVEGFYIEPKELQTLIAMPCNHFACFELTKVSDTTYSCKSVFKEIEFTLPATTRAINANKHDAANSININFQYNHYSNHDESTDSSFCSACHESPCMCSDREQSSSVYDY